MIYITGRRDVCHRARTWQVCDPTPASEFTGCRTKVRHELPNLHPRHGRFVVGPHLLRDIPCENTFLRRKQHASYLCSNGAGNSAGRVV